MATSQASRQSAAFCSSWRTRRDLEAAAAAGSSEAAYNLLVMALCEAMRPAVAARAAPEDDLAAVGEPSAFPGRTAAAAGL